MIRFLRGLIYGIAAGFAAAIVLDVLAENRLRENRMTRKLPEANRPSVDPSENLNDEAKKALLDELDAQI